MATIALIWELGANLGHLGRFLPVARELKARGHQPVLVLRDLARVETMFSGEGVEYHQAPLWLPRVKGLPPDLNFTETLFRFGFLDPRGMTALLRAWRSLLDRLRPDLIVFDHAPTALLATWGYGVPRLLLGNSFSIPPRTRPLPRFRFWQEEQRDAARLDETERRVVRHANIALESIGAPPIREVADLYDCEATIIDGLPPLDVYGQRPNAQYLGPFGNVNKGVEPHWPTAPGKRVFAYVDPLFAATEPMLAALVQARTPSLVYAPGISAEAVRRHASPLVEFSDEPYRMDRLVQQADIGICHAGGTAQTFLVNGKPLLLLPTQMEQTMMSRRIVDLGAGLYLPIDAKTGALNKMLQRLLEEPSFTDAAQRVAANVNLPPLHEAIARLMQRCEELLGESRATA